MIINYVSYFLIYLGLFFMLTGTVGLYRFPDFFTRLHAISVNDALGVPLTLIGLSLTHPIIFIIKTFLLIIVLWLTGILATYALAQSYYKQKN